MDWAPGTPLDAALRQRLAAEPLEQLPPATRRQLLDACLSADHDDDEEPALLRALLPHVRAAPECGPLAGHARSYELLFDRALTQAAERSAVLCRPENQLSPAVVAMLSERADLLMGLSEEAMARVEAAAVRLDSDRECPLVRGLLSLGDALVWPEDLLGRVPALANVFVLEALFSRLPHVRARGIAPLQSLGGLPLRGLLGLAMVHGLDLGAAAPAVREALVAAAAAEGLEEELQSYSGPRAAGQP